MTIKNMIHRKVYFILLGWSMLSVVALLPYAFSLQAETLATVPFPLPIVILISLLQSFVLFGILVFIGLRLTKIVGLQMPILEAYINKQKVKTNTRSHIISSLVRGAIVGVAILLIDMVFAIQGIHLMEQITIPIRQWFLASFYGAIGEEIIMRLFFMTLIVWLFSRAGKSKGEISNNTHLMWWAIIFAALAFGLGHLPATAALTTLTPLVIIRALLLNGMGGMVFGWLYWKRGLEFAMIAHFSADIVLHVLFPLLFL